MPKTNDTLTRYKFTQDYDYLGYYVTLTISRPMQKKRQYKLSSSSYARFVALSSTGHYHIIMPREQNANGWQMYRKPTQLPDKEDHHDHPEA